LDLDLGLEDLKGGLEGPAEADEVRGDLLFEGKASPVERFLLNGAMADAGLDLKAFWSKTSRNAEFNTARYM
jgi:hypothetical protein